MCSVRSLANFPLGVARAASGPDSRETPGAEDLFSMRLHAGTLDGGSINNGCSDSTRS